MLWEREGDKAIRMAWALFSVRNQTLKNVLVDSSFLVIFFKSPTGLDVPSDWIRGAGR